MSGRLEGKVAVVTGGTSGIGLATAKLFTREGAKVFISGRRPDALERAAAAIGQGIVAVQADSAHEPDLDSLFARVSAEAGRLDVLVANAGGGTLLPLGQITAEQIDETFDANVKGVIFTVQKGLPLMERGGSIILTGSTAGVSGTPAFSVYSASKAALRNLARSWAMDLKGSGIRVNVISPGPIRTPGLVGLAGDDQAAQETLLEQFAAGIPLGRVGEPDEVARAALFLATDDASFVHASELFVDGGMAQV